MLWIKFSMPGQYPAEGEHTTPPWDRRGPSPEKKSADRHRQTAVPKRHNTNICVKDL